MEHIVQASKKINHLSKNRKRMSIKKFEKETLVLKAAVLKLRVAEAQILKLRLLFQVKSQMNHEMFQMEKIIRYFNGLTYKLH